MMAGERIQRRIDGLLDQIEKAMDRLDWESVRDIAKVVLGLESDNSDAVAFSFSRSARLVQDLLVVAACTASSLGGLNHSSLYASSAPGFLRQALKLNSPSRRLDGNGSPNFLHKRMASKIR